MESTIWTYPWDVESGGPKEVMETLRDLGLNSVSLATTYHSFDQLRPHLDGPKYLQVGESAAYYTFDKERFDGRIQPVPPEWISTSAWSESVRAAHTAGLKVVAWTLFFHNSRQTKLHPDLAQVACTGDRLTHHLCPSQPEVARYAASLAADIAAHPDVDIIECESIGFGGIGHTHYHPKVGVDLGPGGNFLFSLCFCSACVTGGQSRGINVDALRDAVSSRLEETFRTGRPITTDSTSLTLDIPDLESFCDYREDTVTELIRNTSRAAGKPIRVIAMGNRYGSGLNPAGVAEHVEAIEYLCYTRDTERIHRQVNDASEAVGSSSRVGIGIQAYPPATTSPEDLIESVCAVRESGAGVLSFYNYGIMPPANLEWIRGALTE